jgi:dTMP kinase
MGLFIVFEGVEGSGKSIQSKALKRRLDEAGYPARLIREPGGTPTGESVRQWLMTGEDITPLAELFLFSAARTSLVESVILPALENSEVVVCDRYFYSTVAYQGYGRSLDMPVIRQVNEIATRGLLPHLVVLLDIPPEKGLERKGKGRLDRFEQEEYEFHRRVREGYLEQAMQDPDRWLVLDSTQPRNTIAEAVWQRLPKMLE